MPNIFPNHIFCPNQNENVPWLFTPSRQILFNAPFSATGDEAHKTGHARVPAGEHVPALGVLQRRLPPHGVHEHLRLRAQQRRPPLWPRGSPERSHHRVSEDTRVLIRVSPWFSVWCQALLCSGVLTTIVAQHTAIMKNIVCTFGGLKFSWVERINGAGCCCACEQGGVCPTLLTSWIDVRLDSSATGRRCITPPGSRAFGVSCQR